MTTITKPYTKAYLFEQMNEFRKVMCSTEFSLEQKEAAFNGVSYVWLNTSRAGIKETGGLFESLAAEWSHRRVLEILYSGRGAS